MRCFVGTSGYSYKEWKGSFYPEDLAASRMLGYYAARLTSVELNHTFYRMPTAKALAASAEEVPDGFRFAVKAPQRITHKERLAESEESLQLFAGAVDGLGDKAGPLLFQLPPFLKKDVPRLAAFLAVFSSVAPARRAAFEFRHASWFDDETFAALKAAGAALCISEAEKLEAPLVATAPWCYLRLRRQDYTDADLDRWAAWIRAQRFEETYVYFKHEDSGTGPKLAGGLVARLDG